MKSFGLVGEKLGHSYSPYIHRKFFESNGIEGVYNLFSVDKSNKENIVNSLKTLSISGCNVTIPYKEEVINQLDFISEEAKSIGAVNTIFIKNNKSYGYNTDYYGFGKMLDRKAIEVEGKEFYILGSGGASRSVIKYLIDNKASKVVSVSRDKTKATKKLGAFNIEFISYDDLKNTTSSYAIVNTTPCGMSPDIDSIAVDEEILSQFKVAVDIVYNPIETRFLKAAKSKGLKTVDGLFMLVGQAIKSEEIWNNIKVDRSTEEDIYNCLREKLENMD